MMLWILFCVFYMALSCLYSFWKAFRCSSWQRGIFSLAVCLAFPACGLFLLLFLDWYGEKFSGRDLLNVYMDDTFHGEDLLLLREPDVQKELNLVPMKEALQLNDFSYRRKMIMNLLNEEDILSYLDVLQEALGNEDTETTHYASAILMELQRKTQDLLVEREIRFQKEPWDPDAAAKWEELLYKVLLSGLFESAALERYYRSYYQVSDRLLSGELPSEQDYLHRIRILFLQENLTEAKDFCQRYLKRYPASEDAVLCLLEFYIKGKDAEGMREFLHSLPSLPVRLTQKTLPYIQIFQKE